MAENLSLILAELDGLLEPRNFQDYCPNGLQIQGRGEVKKLVTGVTASLALIDAAIDSNADALLVHHGYFWKGESSNITGMKYQRIRKLIQNDISLLAYHLPLDAHPIYGNNAQLAERLGITVSGGLDDSTHPVGNVGDLKEAVSAEEFARSVRAVLGREPLLEKVGDTPVRRIAWCSGGAQSYIDRAASLGADLYLTGEASEQTIHEARELGIHFIAAGHHATERYGAKAVGEWLSRKLNIDHEFIDIENPV